MHCVTETYIPKLSQFLFHRYLEEDLAAKLDVGTFLATVAITSSVSSDWLLTLCRQLSVL